MTELEKLVAKEKITVQAESTTGKPSTPGAVAWNVTMKYKGKRMATPFSALPGYAPTAADVVCAVCEDCKSLDGTTTFEAWAAKHKKFLADTNVCKVGDPADSRAAYDIWNGIQKSNPRVRKFLGRKFNEFASAAAKHR